MFESNKTAARDALRNFLPRAGRDYASTRNYDLGPDRRENVSMLSPWVRLRLLTEWTILQEVRQQHSDQAASKFIDEVCWRTYWKGWLQQHPQVWDEYLEELANVREAYESHLGYDNALAGKSGIECFDVWTRELVETGYLHNHTRMWYASIWVHTLLLPWVLGADFFHRHLYDGDPASNTLSWRWVAGLHTRGKTYLARADNIAKYTDGRFRPEDGTLAEEAIDLTDEYAKPEKLPFEELPSSPDKGRIGLLLQEDDLSAAEWLTEGRTPVATCGLFPKAAYRAHGITPTVMDFRRQCTASALPEGAALFDSVASVANWAATERLEHVLMAEPPVGIWNPILPEVGDRLKAEGVGLYRTRHWWDRHFYPKAGAGFFKLKKAIPKALEQL